LQRLIRPRIHFLRSRQCPVPTPSAVVASLLLDSKRQRRDQLRLVLGDLACLSVVRREVCLLPRARSACPSRLRRGGRVEPQDRLQVIALAFAKYEIRTDPVDVRCSPRQRASSATGREPPSSRATQSFHAQPLCRPLAWPRRSHKGAQGQYRSTYCW
jgi:hypothetical protein